MGAMIVRHSVHDYGAWRPVYDAHEAARTAAGLTNGRVYRSAEDPNDAMQRAGVVGQPEIRFAD